MTVEERMAKIDQKINSDEEKMRIEEERIIKETHDCLEQLKALAPRIQDILKIAKYAEDNGISLSGKERWGGHEGYDTGLFYSNGWSHLVGLKGKGGQWMGITKGGACGCIDFYTNGEETYGYDTSAKHKVRPSLSDMKHFLNRFDDFETAFYDYIDNLA